MIHLQPATAETPALENWRAAQADAARTRNAYQIAQNRAAQQQERHVAAGKAVKALEAEREAAIAEVAAARVAGDVKAETKVTIPNLQAATDEVEIEKAVLLKAQEAVTDAQNEMRAAQGEAGRLKRAALVEFAASKGVPIGPRAKANWQDVQGLTLGELPILFEAFAEFNDGLPVDESTGQTITMLDWLQDKVRFPTASRGDLQAALQGA